MVEPLTDDELRGQLVIVEYEPDNLGGVILKCRRRGMHESIIGNFPVHIGKWGIFRGASSKLGRLTRDEQKYVCARALAYLTGKK